MIDIDKWEEIWMTIMKHKLRTALTSFGVFWGIFMLVVLLGAGNGLRNGVMQNFDIAKNAVFVWTEETSIAYAGFQPGRNVNLTNDDFEIIKRIKEVRVVSPRTQIGGRFSGGQFGLKRGNREVAYTIMGDYPQYREIKPVKINQGRFINEIDIVEKRKVIIIGERVKNDLFETDEDPIGEYISIAGTPFKVVGIVGTKLSGEEAMQDLQSVYIPNTTLQQAFNWGNNIGWFGLVPSAGTSGAALEEIIKTDIKQRHKIAPEDRSALGSFNVEEEFQEMQGLFAGIAAFSWLVAVGTIIAGMVGVGNIMLIIVRERVKEIGIRKALGARPWSIISMIVQESLVISGFSGYLGLVFGVLTIEGISYALVELGIESDFFSRPEIDFSIAVSAIVVLLVSGVIAGLIPGIKAANVDPVIALRDE